MNTLSLLESISGDFKAFDYKNDHSLHGHRGNQQAIGFYKRITSHDTLFLTTENRGGQWRRDLDIVKIRKGGG